MDPDGSCCALFVDAAHDAQLLAPLLENRRGVARALDACLGADAG